MSNFRMAQTALVMFISSWTITAALYFPPVTLLDTTWKTTAPSTLGWHEEQLDTLYNYLASHNSKAFIVLKDGAIVLEKYFDTFTKDSLWYWASAGKAITSCMVGIAQQEGLLSLSDKTSRWLGNGWTIAPLVKEDLITIRHELTMTSGLDDGVVDPYCTMPSCLSYSADAGTRWAYHNAPYTLLDSVVSIAAGQTFNAYFASKIRTKIGMNGMFIKSGYNNLYVSSARSMARFGLLILNKGSWNTTPIIVDTSYFRHMTNPSQDKNKSYGYLWWLNGKTSFMIPQSQLIIPGSLAPNAPADMIAALGKNGQFINVVPSMNLVFIRMGDAPNNSMVPFTLNDEIWKRLNPVMATTEINHSPVVAVNKVKHPLTPSGTILA